MITNELQNNGAESKWHFELSYLEAYTQEALPTFTEIRYLQHQI